MLEQATMNEESVVSVADVKSGRALAAGRTQPFIQQPTKQNTVRSQSKRKSQTR